MTPAAPGPVGRGPALLLEHLAAVDRLAAPARPSAEERLAAELGGDFSWRLVRALSGERPLRSAAPPRAAVVVAPA